MHGDGSAGDPRTSARQRLDRLWARGRDFLGVETPILCGAMSWISDHRLVAAVAEAGAFGVLAASAMPPEQVAEEIDATRRLTTRPFGVNVVTLHPAFESLIDVCLEKEVPTVVLAGGLPPAKSIALLKAAGVRVMAFAPVFALARRLIRQGVDALILEGREAGGHVGPATTLILMQEILPQVSELPVFVAGGIGRGEAIVTCLEAGAAGCQVGTLFAAAAESPAHPDFKKALIGSQTRDTMVTPQLDPRLRVVPVRGLANQAMQDFLTIQREVADNMAAGAIDATEAQTRIEHFWAGRLRRAVLLGDVESGSVMAGQSVAFVEAEATTKTILDRLVEQAVVTLEGRRAVAA